MFQATASNVRYRVYVQSGPVDTVREKKNIKWNISGVIVTRRARSGVEDRESSLSAILAVCALERS